MEHQVKYKTFTYSGAEAQTALFEYGRKEVHCIISPNQGLMFADQLDAVLTAERHLEKYFGMTTVFKRYFLSDAANQASLLPSEEKCPVSRIQQPPLNGSKVALWVVMEQDADFQRADDGVWEDSRGRIILGDLDCEGENSREETVGCLERLAGAMASRGGSLAENCMRTWFMVHDVDRNYAGVVRGRNEVFAREGLNEHFIASTGIGGSPVDGSVVAFNAIADMTLRPGQMTYIKGASHLNPTIEYGVAFERATAVDYYDRRHVYVSGTASIDNKGQVVWPGDVARQTARMIENIEVLLAEAGCDKGDIMHLLVYLRDIADYDIVNEMFNELLPGIPRVIVLAPVCRPAWLIETECIAVRRASNPEYAEY
ncbi:MAG: hypothetical protein K2O38_07680 [Muribaculaceae bacterium]|nr:hypothetical protein [Muribaculaceae bacterium]